MASLIFWTSCELATWPISVKQKSGVEEHPSVMEVTPNSAFSSGVFRYQVLTLGKFGVWADSCGVTVTNKMKIE